MFRTLLLILGVASAIAAPMFSDPVNSDAGDVDETLAEMYDSPDSTVFKFETRDALVAESTRATGSGDTSETTQAPSSGYTPSPTQSPTYGCEDKTEDDGTEWHDSDGVQYDCEWYGDYNGCDAYGEGYADDNYTANQACCTCGGGNTETGSPTNSPTDWPTNYPTDSPTDYPTDSPTDYPTNSPTDYPTDYPTTTSSPTSYPTDYPTLHPTQYPTRYPTTTSSPTNYLTDSPTEYPTNEPTPAPECEDYTMETGDDWYDVDGQTYTCEWYSEDVNACDAYGDSFSNEGYTANQACCTCGGGTTGSDADSGSGSTESSKEYDSDYVDDSDSDSESDNQLVQKRVKLAPIQAPKAELMAKLIKSRAAPSVESVLLEK